MIHSLDWLRDAAALAVAASFAALPLLLAVLAIDAAIGRRLAARYRSLLWTLVAVRLLLPVAPASGWSLQNVWHLANSVEAPQDLVRRHATPSVAAGGLATSAPTAIVFAKPQAAAAIPVATTAPSIWPPILFNGITILWLAGAGWILLRAVVASVQFANRLRTLPSEHDPAVIELLHEACDQLGVRRRPAVKYVPELSAPALFGMLRPTLCLPAASRQELNDDQLRMIILHELMHVRRRDAWLSWLLTAVQAIHWFNPLAWLVTGRVAFYRELACDDGVRQFTAPNQRSVYAELLLRFAAARPAIRLGLVGMGFARPARSLKARIAAFSHDDVRPGRSTRLAVWSLLAILALSGLTDAATTDSSEEGPMTISEWMIRPRTGAKAAEKKRVFEFVTAPGAIDLPPGAVDDDPAIVLTYDVTTAVTKLAAADSTADLEDWLSSYLPAPASNALVGLSELDLSYDGNFFFSARMSVREHNSFAEILGALAKSGPWQVTVEARCYSYHELDQLKGIDWEQAVKFPPTTDESPTWPRSDRNAAPANTIAASVESVSRQYTPFVAAVVDGKTIERLAEHSRRGNRRINETYPKVTLFNGQRASIRDESYRPFVVGMHYIKGEFDTAAQPDIVTLSEGTRLEVQPLVVDADSLDLNCRLTVSGIDGVSEVKLPGQEVTVQSPRATRHSIDACCRMKPGQTLLIAPAAANVEREAAGKQQNLYFAITAKWSPDTAYHRLNVDTTVEGSGD